MADEDDVYWQSWPKPAPVAQNSSLATPKHVTDGNGAGKGSKAVRIDPVSPLLKEYIEKQLKIKGE